MQIAARVGTMEKNGGIELCAYIQSDGNAWIDSGYIPVEDQRIEAVFALGPTYTRSCYFGISIDSSISTPYCFWGSSPVDRRYFCRIRPDGTDWRYWNVTANDGNSFFDGEFHVFSFPKNPVRRACNITVDDNTDISLTSQYKSTVPKTLPTATLGVFCMKGEDGTIKYITPTSMMKFKSLDFIDSHGVYLAKLRAAKKGDEFGIVDLVDNSWHGGVGGTILGTVSANGGGITANA